MKITAYVMAKNEADIVGRCIEALQWCDKTYLFDTGSTDNTKEVAQQNGAIVRDIKFCGFSPTRNAILDELDTDWVVSFDADEICSKELADEIHQVIKEEKGWVFKGRRINFLFGKEIKHSGLNPDFHRHPILFHKDHMRYDESPVHEGYVTSDKVLRLKNTFDHYPYRHIRQFMHKGQTYAILGSEKLLQRGYKSSFWKALAHGSFTFIRHYLIRLGFLDGKNGFILATSFAYSTFFRYLMAIEKDEEKKQKNACSTGHANG